MKCTRLLAAVGAAVLALFTAVPAASATPSAPPAPDPLTAVPGCENGCETAFVKQLPDNVRFVGLRTVDVVTGLPRSLVAYWIGDQLRAVAEPEELASLQDAACGYDGDAQRCAVTFIVGAHSSSVVSMLLTGDRGIEVTDRVSAGTPSAVLRDVDGNGRPDAVVQQSTYDPAYAGALRYWETWLEFGGKFVRTGCTASALEPADPPTTPVYGTCPAS